MSFSQFNEDVGALEICCKISKDFSVGSLVVKQSL